jgi:hypothetical protein
MSNSTPLSVPVLNAAGFFPSSQRPDLFVHSNLIFHYPIHDQDSSEYWAGQFVTVDKYGTYTPDGPEIRSLEQFQQVIGGK